MHDKGYRVFLFELKSNNMHRHLTKDSPEAPGAAWTVFLSWWRALSQWLDNTWVNAGSPPRTNRHGKEAGEAIISVQELDGFICENTSSFTFTGKECSRWTKPRSASLKLWFRGNTLTMDVVPSSPDSSLSLSITGSALPGSKHDACS